MCNRSTRSPSRIIPRCTPIDKFDVGHGLESVQAEGDLDPRNPLPNLRFKL
jgi:hypothetical protein